jgi:hypothetical protein
MLHYYRVAALLMRGWSASGPSRAIARSETLSMPGPLANWRADRAIERSVRSKSPLGRWLAIVFARLALLALATTAIEAAEPTVSPQRIQLPQQLSDQAKLHASSQSATPPQVQSPAVCKTFRVRESDQIWLISTRHLGCNIGGKYFPQLKFSRYEKGWWQARTETEFFAADSADLITPIYVHGNRVDASQAGSFGLSFYFELVGKFDSEPPVRFVIWSWPSDQIRGPLKDVRAKAARSDYDAWYLGHFLSRMQPDVRVGVLGYSYGARIVSGALHLVGGGSIFGHSFSPSAHPPVRAALWAAAEHNYWYQPNQFHSQAMAAADAWFVTVNYCDPVLAHYRLLDKCNNPCAVGHSGIHGRNLLPPDVNARIEQVNVSNIVGAEHDWRQYLYSRYIQDRTRDYLLWHELSTALPKAPAEAAATN